MAKSHRKVAVAALALLALFLAVGLVASMATMPPPRGEGGVRERVKAEMPASGVRHPVTAVLLNFRAYDTLVEIAVLLMAWLGASSLGRVPRPAMAPPPELLLNLLRYLAPLAILLSAYLLFRGEHAPGGAFHAGALLAAGAVLASLTGLRLPLAKLELPMLVAGLAAFLAVGALCLWANGSFLRYPPSAAKAWILGIETAATFSIAASLALLFDRELLR
jgi:multisubunit Na+/H+ antiporter MnhB subunit